MGLLTLKSLIGFGFVIALGSLVLRQLFRVVAEARSTETFVALSLLVSLGMGETAKFLGLTDTMGAFAAGVLLANSNYRAQVQADILPFKGILLGVFFMEAGSKFDPAFVITELPTILVGSIALVALKAGTLFAATKVPDWIEPHRLPEPDAIRISLLLAGGGEFAFVVLALARKLGILDSELENILIAIVLITMAITPALGDLAGYLADKKARENRYRETLSKRLNGDNKVQTKKGDTNEILWEPGLDDDDNLSTSIPALPKTMPVTASKPKPPPPPPDKPLAPDSIIICGYSEAGRSILENLNDNIMLLPATQNPTPGLARIAAFDTDPSILTTNQKLPNDNNKPVVVTSNAEGAQTKTANGRTITSPQLTTSIKGIKSKNIAVLYGDGASPTVLKSAGVNNPRALFIAYVDHPRVLSAVCRLRVAYPVAPIYTRARNRDEACQLLDAGATEVVIEGDELSRSAVALLRGEWVCSTTERERRYELRKSVASVMEDTDEEEIAYVLDVFACLDYRKEGVVRLGDVKDLVRKSNSGMVSDEDMTKMEYWLMEEWGKGGGGRKYMDEIEFCKMYVKAPESLRLVLGDGCVLF